MNFPIFPKEASTTAVQTDYLFFALFGFSVFVLALVFLPMIVFLFKYRRGKKANRVTPKLSTTKIEVTWTIIPVFISLGLFAWGADIYFNEEVPPADTLEINVIGKQWMWKIQHAEGNREINELHLPVGRAVKLTLASEDVIHSFFIPAFRIKQDVVPGRFTTEWFQPTQIGAYHFYCSEYCGADHSKMQGTVFVMSPTEYENWLARGEPKNSLVQSGENLFRQLGCSGCHVNSTAVKAPPLEGIYGKLVPLSDGTFVRADDKYIRDSILLPASQVSAGYQPVMPTFQGHISEDELLQLIAYIKSIGNEELSKKP
ncbi:MAG TPA: cytochrome c oxidase subunit II [Candidatus Baltobacteraceae bacterium]|nr:cytochrome c oxidase subunit II [Candidatus Baltobacteraceae bacterium]